MKHACPYFYAETKDSKVFDQIIKHLTGWQKNLI